MITYSLMLMKHVMVTGLHFEWLGSLEQVTTSPSLSGAYHSMANKEAKKALDLCCSSL